MLDELQTPLYGCFLRLPFLHMHGSYTRVISEAIPEPQIQRMRGWSASQRLLSPSEYARAWMRKPFGVGTLTPRQVS